MKNKIGIITLIMVMVFSSLVLAGPLPVMVIRPEVKTIEKISQVTGRIEPYKDINISSKIGGVVAEVKVEVGQQVKAGEEIIVFEQQELQAQVKQAEAALEMTRANLDTVLKGASAEDLAQVKATYEQAVASFEGAKKALDIMENMEEDKTTLKQQLTAAKTSFEAAQKQLEMAEERYHQANIVFAQAEKDYQRMTSLYKEHVLTEKEFEAVETQFENAKSNLKNAGLGKEQAQVSYEGAEANYRLARQIYNDPQTLNQQLEGARTQLEVARANVKMAKANLDKVSKGATEEQLISTKASVKQAEAALELARLRLSDSMIKSPTDGIISQLNVEAGEMVGPGIPIVSVVNINKVYVKAELGADLITKVKKADRVKVKIMHYHNRVWQGEIVSVSPVVDLRSQSYPVKVLLNNEGMELKSGLFADLYLTVEETPQAMVLPIEAVLDLDSSPYVYVIEGELAERRMIKMGIQNNEEIEVLSGVNKEDRVVISGQNRLQDGSSVEVVD